MRYLLSHPVDAMRVLLFASSLLSLIALSSSAKELELQTGIPASQETGSCNERGVLRICTDLPKDPEARYACAKRAGIWSSAPCDPPDLGSCEVGPQRILRYYASVPGEAPHAARIQCEALQGTWTEAPREPQRAPLPPGLFPELPQEFRSATHPFRPWSR